MLYVAANYNLRRSSMGWWADGHVFPDGVVRIHLPATIKSLLKLGLLVGNVGAHQCLRRLAQQLLWQPLAVQPLL